MNICSRHVADRLDGRVGQQQLDIAAAVFHVDAQAHQDRGFAGREMAAKRGLVSSRSMVSLTGESGLNASSVSASTTSSMRLTRFELDRRIGTAFDPDGLLAAAAAEQHIDDRIDQARVDRDEPEIVPLLRLEHGEDGRQRNRVEIIAEPYRGDAVERNLDLSDVKLRSDVVISRTRRSKTISSIGRRSRRPSPNR